MASTIKLKNGSGEPLATDLVTAEPAFDLTNKRLYTEDSGGTVIEVGTNPTSLTSGDITVTGTITASGEISANGGIALGDNDVATFGAGDDLQIYHDGTNSYISNSTGGLKLSGSVEVDDTDNLRLRFLNSGTFKGGVEVATDAGDMISTSAVDDLAIRSQSDIRFSTGGNTERVRIEDTGIDVTGTVTTDGLTVNGDAKISSTSPTFRFTETDQTDLNTRITAGGGAWFVQTENNAETVRNDRFRIDHSTGAISFYDTSGNPAFFWDASAERLGIGTTSPSQKLHLVESGSTEVITRTVNDNGFLDVGVKSGGNSYINADGTQKTLVFEVDTSEAMRIDSSGHALIGSTSSAGGTDGPALQVKGASGSTDYSIALMNSVNEIAGQIILLSSGTNAVDIGADPDNLRSGTYLSFSTDNAEAMRIDSSGNVGIGTTTPSSFFSGSNQLVVGSGSSDQGITIYSGTAGNAQIFFADGTSGADAYRGILRYIHSDNAMTFYTDGANERMRIDSSGNVSVTGEKFNLGGTSNNAVFNSNFSMNFNIDADNNGSEKFAWGHNGDDTTTSKLMTLDASGNLLVGGSALSFGVPTVQIGGSDGDAFLTIRRNGTGTSSQIRFYNPNGTVGEIYTSGSSTTYSTTSDYRLKENVVDMTGAVDRVKALNPSRFNFIADPDTIVDGFLAHEVADVVPEAIKGVKDAMRTEEYEVTPAVLDEDGNVVTEAVMGTREVPDYQGIDQSKLVPLLTGALQEAIARIETLEAQVATLQGN